MICKLISYNFIYKSKYSRQVFNFVNKKGATHDSVIVSFELFGLWS
jgi:hypothetical protein